MDVGRGYHCRRRAMKSRDAERDRGCMFEEDIFCSSKDAEYDVICDIFQCRVTWDLCLARSAFLAA